MNSAEGCSSCLACFVGNVFYGWCGESDGVSNEVYEPRESKHLHAFLVRSVWQKSWWSMMVQDATSG